MKKSNKKGFTIVELVIVIAVIAILAAVLIPTFSGLVEKGQASSRLQTAQNALKVTLAAQSDASLDDNTKFFVKEGGTVVASYTYSNGVLTLDGTTESVPTAASGANVISHGTVNAASAVNHTGTIADLPTTVTVVMSDADAAQIQ